MGVANKLYRRVLIVGLAAAAAGSMPAAAQQPKKTLRVVMHSDLKILDPMWTTAYIVRNHGYMIYDTLFSVDAKLEPKPQMVDTWSVSDDRLTYTFALRDGLNFHDGAPVTSDDVIASLKRWGVNDTVGKRLMRALKEFKAVDAKTFQIVLTEPFNYMIKALAKPSSTVPFILPKRVAETPASQQIRETIGSGPFVFKQDEWRVGEKVVYEKNPAYKPRSEPADGLAGGKVVKLDRVEWIAIPDSQTAVNALIVGEVDMIEAPAQDLLPLLKKDKNIEIVQPNETGGMYLFRFNSIQPPFDNQKIRRAAIVALNQEDFLRAQIGDPESYKVCKGLFGCGTPFESTYGMDGLLESRFNESRKLLQEAGYDGTPVVLLHSTDVAGMANLAPVAKSLLEKGGFKVDMQSMDWQSLLARWVKKDAPNAGGWNALAVSAATALLSDPVINHYTEATGASAFFGWPKDEKVEELRSQFLQETDPAKQLRIAELVQARVMEVGISVPLGQYLAPFARRKTVSGNVRSPVPVFWGVEKR